MMFWGGLLLVVDVPVTMGSGSDGVPVDVVHDFAGMLLIAPAVLRVGLLNLPPGHGRVLSLVLAVSLVSTGLALADPWLRPETGAVAVVRHAYLLVEPWAAVLFCLTLGRLCNRAGLEAPATSWKRTAIHVAVLLALPLAGLHGMHLLSSVTGKRYGVGYGAAHPLVIAVFAFPVFHFLFSTVRLSRSLREHAAVETGGPS